MVETTLERAQRFAQDYLQLCERYGLKPDVRFSIDKNKGYTVGVTTSAVMRPTGPAGTVARK